MSQLKQACGTPGRLDVSRNRIFRGVSRATGFFFGHGYWRMGVFFVMLVVQHPNSLCWPLGLGFHPRASGVICDHGAINATSARSWSPRNSGKLSACSSTTAPSAPRTRLVTRTHSQRKQEITGGLPENTESLAFLSCVAGSPRNRRDLNASAFYSRRSTPCTERIYRTLSWCVECVSSITTF